MHGRIHEVDAAVGRHGRLCQEDKGPVGVHAGDRLPDDLLHVVPFLRREAEAVVSGGEGAEDQLVREGLHRVAQTGVGDVVFIKLQLVQVDELGIERVEELRLEGQRLEVDISVPDPALDLMAEAAVQETQLARRVILGHEAEVREVVLQPVEALHALLQGSGDRLGLDAAFAVPERQGGLQGLAEDRFDRLPGREDIGFGEAPDLRPGQEEPAGVIDREQVPGHQLQRFAAQGSAVHALALGEAEHAGHDLDGELGQARTEVPAVAPDVIQEAPGAEPLQLFNAGVCFRLLGVLDHGREVRGLWQIRHPMSSAMAFRRSSSICSLKAAASCASGRSPKGSSWRS